MDLREKKTKRSIKNAFLQLRANKPLERITIKELAELAEISKATFYLHYRDIYDLSNGMEKEVIQNILSSISGESMSNPNSKQFVNELFAAFYAQQSLTNILFSGSRAAVLPTSIELEIRELLVTHNPNLAKDEKYNILLSYQIQGGFYAYQENCKKYSPEILMDVIGSAAAILFKM